MNDVYTSALEFNCVTVSSDGDLAIVSIDNPPVNATSHAVRIGLWKALDALEVQDSVKAIVLTCKGKNFICGADIREFDRVPEEPLLPAVVDRIECFAKPVVAAIQGSALGAGAEVAMACHARVMIENARFAFPEVKLGLIPGAGGTQRLPSLIGLSAIDILCSGESVPALQALRLGFADQIAVGNVIEVASECARSLIGMPLRRCSELPIIYADSEAVLEKIKALRQRYKASQSVQALLDVLALSLHVERAEAFDFERKTFLKLKQSDQAAALRHMFFAERSAGKLEGVSGLEPRPLENIGVVGAGLMGTGIAMACLDGGYNVVLTDTAGDALSKAKAKIGANYEKLSERGKITAEEAANRLARLTCADTLRALEASDLVIEAIVENIDAKVGLFRALDDIVPRETILATNTSYLDVNEISSATAVPERVLGLHFFSPANLMRLVEVVRPQTVALPQLVTGVHFARRLGKTPVVTGVCDGFVGNRIFSVWRRQVEFMLEEGALPHQIDAALEAYGFAMGPFAVYDMAGLEITAKKRKAAAASRDPQERHVEIWETLFDLGRVGQKSGSGWYDYSEGHRQPDPKVTEIIEAHSQKKGFSRRAIEPREIEDRVRAAIVNEAAKCLEEGIAKRPSDIDIVLVRGYGFPEWRGGPLFDADRHGLANVLETVSIMNIRDGKSWAPPQLLKTLVEQDRTFASLND